MARRNKKRIYSIILINHNKQLKTLCSEETEAKIYKRLKGLLKESNNVVFPIEFNNHYHHMIDSKYELAIIKCKELYDTDVNKIRNNYGEFVDYETSDEDWIVIDRVNYNIEETFWVYGYHPKLQRKTFEWIFDEFIEKNSKNKYMFKSIQIFKNKVLIECDGKLNMVICKNKKDSTRFYNLVEQWCKKKKIKYIAFLGDADKSKHKMDVFNKIQSLTNWDKHKINRNSTRP